MEEQPLLALHGRDGHGGRRCRLRAAERAFHGQSQIRECHVRCEQLDAGVELLAPHVTFADLRLTVKGPFGRPKPAAAPAVPVSPVQRQERLLFHDSLSGRIYTTLKIQLDLPVLGVRTLDQALRLPIQEGSLDYRALEKSLDWLEGTFLDIKHDDGRLKI